MSQFQTYLSWIRDWIKSNRVASYLTYWPVIILVLLLAWLLSLSLGDIPDNFHEGDIAPYDIRADRQYVLIDEKATESRRNEAASSVLSVYDFNTGLIDERIASLKSAFSLMREKIATVNEKRIFEVGTDPSSKWRESFENALNERVTDAQWSALLKAKFNLELEFSIISEISKALSGPIVANTELLSKENDKGIVLRSISGDGEKQEISEERWQGDMLSSLKSIEEVRKNIKLNNYENNKLLREFTISLIQPNCAPNLLETEARRNQLLKGVTPVAEKVKAGEMLVRRYEPYSSRQIWILEHIREQKTSTAWPLQSLGYVIYIGAVLLALHMFGVRHIRKYIHAKSDLFFLGSLLVVMVIILRTGGFCAEALSMGLPLSIPRAAYYYLIPMAAGSMMVRFLLNAETAMLFAACLAAISGLVLPHDPSFAAYILLINVAGALFIVQADKRSALMRAGALAGIYAGLIVLAMHLVRVVTVSEVLSWSTTGWYILMTLLGGFGAALVVLALTPLAEYFFDYTSDIKLLELANLNHPLLRELVIRAPGTYHHSHLVGILAESAASVIGANALLARVGAYYHDIGKIKKPLYFTENAKGSSPHERLNPHMSALIISSHVKEGMELARSYKLPQAIIDMIPQHHGTKMIGYFYEQAKNQADPELGEVDERDFRYPGPKPQTREAGLLLLADGVEGAVRALKEKSPTRVKQTVDTVINKSFAEGQLDECEITLKDLHEVGNAFTRILLGIYHQRIEYPKEALALRNKDVQLVDAGEDNKKEKEDNDDSPETRAG